jgi:hypothetical protein
MLTFKLSLYICIDSFFDGIREKKYNSKLDGEIESRRRAGMAFSNSRI